MLKFSKIISSKSQKLLRRKNSEYLRIFHLLRNECFKNLLLLVITSGTRDLWTPMATPLQPPRTFCLVTIIRNFLKITLVGPILRHLYPHR
jgi:hypothetical protein